MDKSDIYGAGQIAAGSYIGYQGIKHGLPRMAGIRIECHTTKKENAELIKKAGNILDPNFGGKNGWSEAVKSKSYINHSKGYIHITGIHKDTKLLPNFGKFESIKGAFKPFHRVAQNIMYKTVGNIDLDKIISEVKKCKTGKDKIKLIGKTFMSPNLLKDKTKRFYIPGIDSYFNKEFIPDTDDLALKTTKKLKCYNNRFSAMIAGIKEFGLKGIKENKGRVAFGAGLVALGLYGGAKLVNKGIKNISKNDETQN